MPVSGAVTLFDLRDRGYDRLRISCGKCPRQGSLGIPGALNRWGDAKLPDLLGELTADCTKGKGADVMDQCGARYVGL